MTTKTLHSRKQNGDTHSEIPAATAGYAKVAYCVVGAGTSGWALGGRELLLRLSMLHHFFGTVTEAKHHLTVIFIIIQRMQKLMRQLQYTQEGWGDTKQIKTYKVKKNR